MFIDASKENRYTSDNKEPIVFDEKCLKEGEEERTALELELEGRIRGLDLDVKALDTSSRRNEGNVEYRTSDLKMLQMVTVVLRFVYYVVLVVGLVLYAYERWFEYYEDEAHDEAFLFILVGTALVVGPQYILDAVIYAYGMFADFTSHTTD